MEANDNPYDLLGVSRDATDAEIRTAYRKLALKHHPDKQRNEEDRQRSTKLFAKISNAYEILSDKDQRRQYDREQQQGGFSSSSFGDHFSSFHSHFHDPFSVFESVFREEFGRPRETTSFRDPFQSFFGDPFGSSMMGGSLFGNDPFFGDPFGSMRRMNSRNYHHQQQPQQQRSYRDPFEEMFSSLRNMQDGSNNNNSSFYSYTSSSTTSQHGGETVTTQTTTKMINGQRETVTERIVRKADGTVERQVLNNGNQQPQALPDAEDRPRLPWRKSKRKRPDPPQPEQDRTK